ncbi:hypothetical protein R1flu_012753 [Riccia fluitans]|uniref:Uncharacterized protein n=1 Tax=Riccia fluitans TaxID=41844 RepID=A0ABD1ZBV1_9MARC
MTSRHLFPSSSCYGSASGGDEISRDSDTEASAGAAAMEVSSTATIGGEEILGASTFASMTAVAGRASGVNFAMK